MHRQRVLVEVDETSQASVIDALMALGFALDRAFPPMPMQGRTIVLRGWIQPSQLAEMRSVPGVHSVSEDPQIEPFAEGPG